MASKLLVQTLEELAAAAIVAEISNRFASVDPAAIITDHIGVIETKAEELGIVGSLLDEDLEAVAALVDGALAQVEVTFS